MKPIIVMGAFVGLGVGAFIGAPIGLYLASSPTLAEPVKYDEELKNEADYQLRANEVLQGTTEYVLDDRTRVDILTDDAAVEVEFADKWYEAIGQASHYAVKTNRRPMIVLVVDDPKLEKYVQRCIRTCRLMKVRLQLEEGIEYYSPTVLVMRNYK